MGMTCDEQPEDIGVAATAAREPQPPDNGVDEPPAEDMTGGDEEAGYGYGV